jgi:cyclic pyranopterin phosphate synthase
MAAKRTSDLIPLCHPLEITAVDVSFRTDARRGEIEIEATVRPGAARASRWRPSRR